MTTKIVITNTVLANAGDAAIFESIVLALERKLGPDAIDLTVFDANAAATTDLYPDYRVLQQYIFPPLPGPVVRRFALMLRCAILIAICVLPPARWLAKKSVRSVSGPFSDLIRIYSDADLIVSSGGTYLVDHYRFEPRVLELVAGKKLGGGRLVLWTQSMGPFNSRSKRIYMRALTKVTEHAYLRDERSLAAWQSVSPNCQDRATVIPDSVFALSKSPYESTAPVHKARRGLALVSVRDWKRGLNGELLDPSQYSSAIRECVRVLATMDFDVVAVSTCQGIADYKIDDSTTARQILQHCDVEILTDHYSPADLGDRIANADLVVTTRMHMAILSLIAQTPVMAVAYENKTVDLFGGLGLREFVVEIERFDTDWVKSNLQRLVELRSESVLGEECLDRLNAMAMLPASALGTGSSINP